MQTDSDNNLKESVPGMHQAPQGGVGGAAESRVHGGVWISWSVAPPYIYWLVVYQSTLTGGRQSHASEKKLKVKYRYVRTQ